jgi:hypothetical protein
MNPYMGSSGSGGPGQCLVDAAEGRTPCLTDPVEDIAALPGHLCKDRGIAPDEALVCVIPQLGMKAQGLGRSCGQAASRQVPASRFGCGG